MDELLSSILSSDEARKLGIPSSSLPPIIEPLPKQESFTHLPSLKRVYLEKALCHLYNSFPLKKKPNVALFTWVMGDGLGDFSAQIETAKALLSASMNVSLISLHPDRMPLSPPSLDCPHTFIPYQEDTNGTWDHIDPVKVPQEALSAAHVILQIPTYFPHTKELLSPFLQKKLHRPTYELIGEGGWGATPRFSPISGSRSLGLRSWEKGLFFPKIASSSDSFKQDSNTKLCLGYIRNPQKCLLLLQTFLVKMSEDTSDLTLRLFPIESLIVDLPSLTPFFKKHGIKEVKVYYEEHLSCLNVQEKGKTLSLFQTKKMAREEYQKFLSQSDSLVGCRGDGSLSETLSAKKLPFFDFPLHKRPLLEGLSSIANHQLSSSHETSKYLQEFLKANPSPYTLGSLAKDPNTLAGFLKLYPFLEKYYSVTDFIINLTKRAACHHFYPGMAILEKNILDSFFFGEKSAFSALKEVQKELLLLYTSSKG